MPEDYAEKDAIYMELLSTPVVEIGGVWKNRSSRSFGARMSLTVHVQKAALKHCPKGGRMLFGYNHNVEHLRNLYAGIGAKVLYRGPIQMPTVNGEIEECHVSIEYLPRNEALISGIRVGIFHAQRGAIAASKSVYDKMPGRKLAEQFKSGSKWGRRDSQESAKK